MNNCVKKCEEVYLSLNDDYEEDVDKILVDYDIELTIEEWFEEEEDSNHLYKTNKEVTVYCWCDCGKSIFTVCPQEKRYYSVNEKE